MSKDTKINMVIINIYYSVIGVNTRWLKQIYSSNVVGLNIRPVMWFSQTMGHYFKNISL